MQHQLNELRVAREPIKQEGQTLKRQAAAVQSTAFNAETVAHQADKNVWTVAKLTVYLFVLGFQRQYHVSHSQSEVAPGLGRD